MSEERRDSVTTVPPLISSTPPPPDDDNDIANGGGLDQASDKNNVISVELESFDLPAAGRLDLSPATTATNNNNNNTADNYFPETTPPSLPPITPEPTSTTATTVNRNDDVQEVKFEADFADFGNETAAPSSSDWTAFEPAPPAPSTAKDIPDNTTTTTIATTTTVQEASAEDDEWSNFVDNVPDSTPQHPPSTTPPPPVPLPAPTPASLPSNFLSTLDSLLEKVFPAPTSFASKQASTNLEMADDPMWRMLLELTSVTDLSQSLQFKWSESLLEEAYLQALNVERASNFNLQQAKKKKKDAMQLQLSDSILQPVKVGQQHQQSVAAVVPTPTLEILSPTTMPSSMANSQTSTTTATNLDFDLSFFETQDTKSTVPAASSTTTKSSAYLDELLGDIFQQQQQQQPKATSSNHNHSSSDSKSVNQLQQNHHSDTKDNKTKRLVDLIRFRRNKLK